MALYYITVIAIAIVLVLHCITIIDVLCSRAGNRTLEKH